MTVEYDMVFPDGEVETEVLVTREGEPAFELVCTDDVDIEHVPKEDNVVKIYRATYGNNQNHEDVSYKIANLYRNGLRKFHASNHLFGDPCPGYPK